MKPYRIDSNLTPIVLSDRRERGWLIVLSRVDFDVYESDGKPTWEEALISGCGIMLQDTIIYLVLHRPSLLFASLAHGLITG